MHQSALRGFVLFFLVSYCQSLHVPLDLFGWEPLPLNYTRVVELMKVAANHIQGALKDPVTAFKWIEDVPIWDLYRLSFRSTFRKGDDFECHADVSLVSNPPNVTVFNAGCMAITVPPKPHVAGATGGR